MIKLNEQDIKDIINGAAILAGGGGGSVNAALNMLEKHKKLHPDKVNAILIKTNEMEAGKYAATVAGMGAPQALHGIDFTKHIFNSYEALKNLAKNLDTPKDIEYALAVELGAFSTFIPILVSMMHGIPIIDTDGAGRAVPGLDVLLYSVNGLDTSPIVMADDTNNKVEFQLSNPKDAKLAEKLCRAMTTEFGDILGIAGWILDRDQIENSLATGTISLSLKIGKLFRESKENNSLDTYFNLLKENNIVESQLLTTGIVTEFFNETKGGYDYGHFLVKDEEGNIWKTQYQNENLTIRKNDNIVVTVPEIITTFDLDSGVPLTNADIKENQKIAIGIMKVNEKWWKNPDMPKYWQSYLDRIDYNDKLIKLEDINL